MDFKGDYNQSFLNTVAIKMLTLTNIGMKSERVHIESRHTPRSDLTISFDNSDIKQILVNQVVTNSA